MKVMVLGLGVIGTTYGYVLSIAGHEIAHLIRAEKQNVVTDALTISLLDGRKSNKGVSTDCEYNIRLASQCDSFDFILVSVSSGKLRQAVKTLKENRIKGTLLIFCNFWYTREEIKDIVGDYKYIIGFPTAGGRLQGNILECVLFDHIMLESKEKSGIENYELLASAFDDAQIKLETPYDMIQWIWLHMAINAGVTITAAKDGAIENPAKLASDLMGNADALREAVLTIRETVKIVAARGVDLKKYSGELWAYKIPSHIAGIAMKKLFMSNELTRRIMLLHSDLQDILYGCSCVYDTGRRLNVKTPLFSAKFESVMKALPEDKL